MTIVRAQIVFLLTTFTEESFESASAEIRTVSAAVFIDTSDEKDGL